MKYYYITNDEKAHGPKEESHIRELYRKGYINDDTYIADSKGYVLGNYKEVFLSKKSSGMFNMNKSIDNMLTRLFALPSFIGSDPDTQNRQLDKLASIVGLSIFLSYILVSIGAMCAKQFLLVPVIWLVGFIIQYICYQFYTMTQSLITGPKITLSSMGVPRLIGVCCLVGVIVQVIFALFTVRSFGGFFEAVLGILPNLTMIFICYSADKLFVEIKQGEVSPGRELNNLLRFIVRASVTVLHILTPVLTLLAALSLTFTIGSIPSMMGAGASGFAILGNIAMLAGVVGSSMVVINLPIITWCIFCFSSWIFDLLDAIFSLGSIRKS